MVGLPGRAIAVTLALMGMSLGGIPPAAAQQDQQHPGTSSAVTLSAVALDSIDDNRFFTRVGGTVLDTVHYQGLVPGQAYTLAAQLLNLTTDALVGEPVLLSFTPESAEGEVSVELPAPENRTESNIHYLVTLALYEGTVDAARMAGATAVARLDDAANEEQIVQIHAIQSIAVTAVDAADGDRILPAEGGTITATVTHANLVSGYDYTLWGQLLTPSGQSTGIYASIPHYVPADKNGEVTMEFTVPEGFEGLRLIPSVGLYHQNRTVVDADGSLTWLKDAPQPVMIASAPDVDVAERSIAIGVPFEDRPPAP